MCSSDLAQHTRTARRTEVKGRLFADCTGDAAVGYLAGADYEVSSEGQMGASNLWNVLDQADREKVLECECKDKDALTVLERVLGVTQRDGSMAQRVQRIAGEARRFDDAVWDFRERCGARGAYSSWHDAFAAIIAAIGKKRFKMRERVFKIIGLLCQEDW